MIILFAVLLWVIAPMIVGHNIGKRKNRAGTLYGFLLG
jgi:hypothetical protein